MRIFLFLVALELFGACPVYLDKCEYHGWYHVPKVRTEYRNGKEFGVYEHQYTDQNGRQKTCRIIVQCP